MRSVLLVAALVLMAGCVSEPEVTPQNAVVEDALPWWVKALPASEVDDKGEPVGDTPHVHADLAQHMNLSTPNFHVFGYDPLTTDFLGATATGMGCGGVGETAEGRRIALVHSIDTDVAFVVADVTDPAAPQMLGEYVLPNVVVWDATITPDGKHAVVGANANSIFWLLGDRPKLPVGLDTRGVVPVQPLFRDACTGETRAVGPTQYLPYEGSIILVGLNDPTNPTFEDWVPQGYLGPHSVGAFDVDGKTMIVSSVTNLVHPASYYTFFDLAMGPAGGKLVASGFIRAPGITATPQPGGSPFGTVFSLADNGHVDAWIQKHPITGKTLAYISNWNDGMRIYDITDLKVPVEIAHWQDDQLPPEDKGSFHSAVPLDVLWDGRHYTIGGQEVDEQTAADRPSGWIYVFDTTDPAKPTEVARWTLPVKVPWAARSSSEALRFSIHYPVVHERTMFVPSYHAGVWAVDLTDPASPKTIGVFIPDRGTPTPLNADKPREVMVEEVLVGPDGILTMWDNGGGIYQVHFDATAPAPEAPAWDGSTG